MILAGQFLLLFLLIFMILWLIFGIRKEKKVKKRNGHIKYTPQTWLFLIGASAGITILINAVSASSITTMVMFIAVVMLLPYVYESNMKRKHMEAIFQDVILYCSTMGMLLKQTKNVYSSLLRAREDLRTELADDLKSLIEIMDDGDKSRTQEAMKQIEKNYPYTCIVNLDLIMLHMVYENANLDSSLFDTYQDDVSELEKDIRRNMIKRLSLRIQYIGISAGCLFLYWWFMKQLTPTYPEGFATSTFKMANLGFISATFIVLFIVDRYFNANISKE